MKVLFDTSVLVAAMVETHPSHERALFCLQRIKDGTNRGVVSAHTLAELYAILTRLPVRPRILPTVAYQLIAHNVIGEFEVVSLSNHEYTDLIEHLSGLGIIGCVTYDAVILRAAIKANVEQIVTLNPGDFRRVYPKIADEVVSP